jgi:DNA adenine methylase
MKPFFRYHGGKQYMATKILTLIPEHRVYCEPFIGAGSLLFAKPFCCEFNKHDYLEVINDNLDFIINFYEQAKLNTEELFKLVDSRLYSESWFKISCQIIKDRANYSPVEVAWAIWYKLNCSFGGGGTSFAYGISRSLPGNFRIKIENFLAKCQRLKDVCIHNRDAIEAIKYYDSDKTFFYLDPPYVDTEMKVYKDFSIEKYMELIDTLKQIKGKFLLSGYANEYVSSEWRYLTYETVCHSRKAEKKLGETKPARTEYLWFNYDLPTEQHKFNVPDTNIDQNKVKHPVMKQLSIPGIFG